MAWISVGVRHHLDAHHRHLVRSVVYAVGRGCLLHLQHVCVSRSLLRQRLEFSIPLTERLEKDHPSWMGIYAHFPNSTDQGRRFEYASFKEDEAMKMASRLFYDIFVVDVARSWHKLSCQVSGREYLATPICSHC